MIGLLEQMTSGECRFVGRVDIHVYCRAPAGQSRVFKVWTVDSEGSPWEPDGWVDAAVAAGQIEAILEAGEQPSGRAAAA
jgi:hypothetical protein